MPLSSPRTGNIFCNLPRMHSISFPMASPRSTPPKCTLPIQQSILGSRALMRRKYPHPKRANKATVTMSSPRGTQEKNKFLYCLLLSPFLITFELAPFTRHTFHYTHIHVGNMCRPKPQRVRRSTQGETSSCICQYLLLVDQYNN